MTDKEGLVLGVLTTPANVNEISILEEILDTADIPKDVYVYGDKVYKSAKNEDILKAKKLKRKIVKRTRKIEKQIDWKNKI